jgi:hypothetical protein
MISKRPRKSSSALCLVIGKAILLSDWEDPQSARSSNARLDLQSYCTFLAWLNTELFGRKTDQP